VKGPDRDHVVAVAVEHHASPPIERGEASSGDYVPAVHDYRTNEASTSMAAETTTAAAWGTNVEVPTSGSIVRRADLRVLPVLVVGLFLVACGPDGPSDATDTNDLRCV
jgi:hypothetical protein